MSTEQRFYPSATTAGVRALASLAAIAPFSRSYLHDLVRLFA